MSASRELRAARLSAAINALAVHIPNGELLVATDPAQFILATRDRIVDLIHENDALRAQRTAACGEGDRKGSVNTYGCPLGCTTECPDDGECYAKDSYAKDFDDDNGCHFFPDERVIRNMQIQIQSLTDDAKRAREELDAERKKLLTQTEEARKRGILEVLHVVQDKISKLETRASHLENEEQRYVHADRLRVAAEDLAGVANQIHGLLQADA